MTRSTGFIVCSALLLAAGAAQANVSLGSFTFASDQFGNSLAESDGGTFSADNWLNVNDVDPGNPAFLTGANFNTGIANIGLGSTPSYTIGYGTAIVNGAGADLGVVTGRFSLNDTISLSVSSDGVNFSPVVNYGAALGVATGVPMSYYYAGTGPYAANLFVTPIDLNDFGLSSGAAIVAVRVTGSPELDLIRVAGITASVPEPDTYAMLALGVGVVGVIARRRRVQATSVVR